MSVAIQWLLTNLTHFLTLAAARVEKSGDGVGVKVGGRRERG